MVRRGRGPVNFAVPVCVYVCFWCVICALRALWSRFRPALRVRYWVHSGGKCVQSTNGSSDCAVVAAGQARVEMFHLDLVWNTVCVWVGGGARLPRGAVQRA